MALGEQEEQNVRVAFDPQTFLRQRTGGISRLFADLIGAFYRDPALGVEPELPFTWVNNEYLARDLSGRGIKRTPNWLPREALYLPWVFRGTPRTRAEIVHHTYYSGRFLGPIGGALRACTVYDMIPELFAGSDWFTGSHLRKSDYVRRSDLVICISESTKTDMETIYGPTPGKVVVVPSAVGPGFGPGWESLPGLPSQYLLYVGGRKGYKDFPVLLDALAALAWDGSPVPLVVVGPPWTALEVEHMRKRGVEALVRQMSLSDADLRRAYAHAAVVVQTSRYEGFGMTPLEGMASGAPVVVANASSMPEVCGDVGCYFDVGDAGSLASQIGRLLADDRLRADLGTRGVERARLFAVDRMAERTAAAYRQVLSEA